jgi:hypothetical protein
VQLIALRRPWDALGNGTEVIRKADTKALGPPDMGANDPLQLVRMLRAQHPRATDEEL